MGWEKQSSRWYEENLKEEMDFITSLFVIAFSILFVGGLVLAKYLFGGLEL